MTAFIATINLLSRAAISYAVTTRLIQIIKPHKCVSLHRATTAARSVVK